MRNCPKCGLEMIVIDSRLSAGGLRIRRRRKCPGCNERATTYELPAEQLDSLEAFQSSLDEIYALAKSLTRAVDSLEVNPQVTLHVGREIRRDRIALGLSVQELARLAGLHFTTVYCLERGERPAEETLEKVRNALKGKAGAA